MRSFLTAVSVVLALALAGCGSGGSGGDVPQSVAQTGIPVTIESGGEAHRFVVELADTPEEQAQGSMFRTDLTPDGGMLFYPYPASGGGPREASFWMRNTPTPLDIIFIRTDGTIARIAENTIPYSEAPILSGEPVGAVLELVGGRSAELGLSPGDRVKWAGGPGG